MLYQVNEINIFRKNVPKPIKDGVMDQNLAKEPAKLGEYFVQFSKIHSYDFATEWHSIIGKFWIITINFSCYQHLAKK